MEHHPDCRAETRRHGDIEAVTCAPCATVEWFRGGRPIVADVALAALFGDYDLVAVAAQELNRLGLEVRFPRPVLRKEARDAEAPR